MLSALRKYIATVCKIICVHVMLYSGQQLAKVLLATAMTAQAIAKI